MAIGRATDPFGLFSAGTGLGRFSESARAHLGATWDSINQSC